MTTNKPNVQRYADMGAEQICPVNNMYGSDYGDYVLYEEYESLQAERDHYKSVIREVTTRNLVERWSKTAADKELEQYLSDGISQLENEHRKQIEALQAECEKLRALLLQSAPIIHAHAGASHMLEGFKPKRNKWDALVEQIDAACRKQQEGRPATDVAELEEAKADLRAMAEASAHLSDDNHSLREKLKAVRSQEPVGVIDRSTPGRVAWKELNALQDWIAIAQDGTKLYAVPPEQ